MAKLPLFAALGLAVGFVASSDVIIKPAHACSCLGYIPWTLTFVEASPDVDATEWRVDNIYLNRDGDRNHSLHSPSRFELYMERQ
jgi:hypothetical protein